MNPMDTQYIDHKDYNSELQLPSLSKAIKFQFIKEHNILPLKPITDLIFKSNDMSLYSNLTAEKNFQEEFLLYMKIKSRAVSQLK